MSPDKTSLSLMAICDGIASTLASVAGINRTQSYDEITDGMNTFPTAQVYIEEVQPLSETSHNAFQRGLDRLRITVHLDILCAVANGPGLGDIHGEITEIFDDIVELFQSQAQPYFGTPGIRGFTWRGFRTVFQYANYYYPSIRFIITLETY